MLTIYTKLLNTRVKSLTVNSTLIHIKLKNNLKVNKQFVIKQTYILKDKTQTYEYLLIKLNVHYIFNVLHL